MFHYINLKKYNIAFVQETHSCVETERLWSCEYGSKIWFSHGSRDSKGVAILFNKKSSGDIKVHNVIKDNEGRFIVLYVTMHGLKWVLACVYAPNTDQPQFFQKFFKEVERFTPDYMIIGGDFNLALNCQIDRVGSMCNNDKSASWLSGHLQNTGLVDLWREMHPEDSGFTYRKMRPKVMYNRLDYFLTSEETMQYVDRVDIVPGFRTDHSIVSVKLRFHHEKRGPGYWKLNTALLRDKDYVDRINNLLEIMLGQEGNTYKTHSEQWEVMKLAVRGSTIQYAARKQKSTKQKIEVLEKKLRSLEREIKIDSQQFMDTENQIRLVRHELNDLLKYKTKGAIILSRCNWATAGKRPTKYFLNLEKR